MKTLSLIPLPRGRVSHPWFFRLLVPFPVFTKCQLMFRSCRRGAPRAPCSRSERSERRRHPTSYPIPVPFGGYHSFHLSPSRSRESLHHPRQGLDGPLPLPELVDDDLLHIEFILHHTEGEVPSDIKEPEPVR
jgi:hypothetical protein